MEKTLYYKFYLKTTINDKEVLTLIDKCPVTVKPILDKAFNISCWTFIGLTRAKYRLKDILSAYTKLIGNSQYYRYIIQKDGKQLFERSKGFMKNVLEACYKNQEHRIVIKIDVDNAQNKNFVEQER